MSLIEATRHRLRNEGQLHSLGLAKSATVLSNHMNRIVLFGNQAIEGDPEQLQNAARDLSFSLAHVFIGELRKYNFFNMTCWLLYHKKLVQK